MSDRVHLDAPTAAAVTTALNDLLERRDGSEDYGFLVQDVLEVFTAAFSGWEWVETPYEPGAPAGSPRVMVRAVAEGRQP